MLVTLSNAYLPDPPSFFLSLIFRRGVVAEGQGTRLTWNRVNLATSACAKTARGALSSPNSMW